MLPGQLHAGVTSLKTYYFTKLIPGFRTNVAALVQRTTTDKIISFYQAVSMFNQRSSMLKDFGITLHLNRTAVNMRSIADLVIQTTK